HDFVSQQILSDDDIAFGADHLGDLGDAARTVAQALGLHDHVDRTHDHFANGLGGKLEAAHGDHRFQTRHGFARTVGVERAHRAVVAGVHRLQKVEGLGSAHFAHDDAFGTHTQTVSYQIAHRDLALSFEVGRTGFETHDVRLLQLQFGGVFAGDDAFFGVDVSGQAVQQCRLARTCTAGDQDVATRSPDDAEHARARRIDRAEAHEVLECELVLLELTNGERWPVERKRRRYHVDAGTIEQARVAYRRTFVDAAADLAHDALADVHQLRIVAEADWRELHLAAHFDEDAARAVDHDVGDIVARKQRFEGAVTQHVVADVLEQVFLLRDGHHHRLDRDDLVDDVADFLARGIGIELRKLREVDGVDQRVEDRRLDLVVILAAGFRHALRRRRRRWRFLHARRRHAHRRGL